MHYIVVHKESGTIASHSCTVPLFFRLYFLPLHFFPVGWALSVCNKPEETDICVLHTEAHMHQACFFRYLSIMIIPNKAHLLSYHSSSSEEEWFEYVSHWNGGASSPLVNSNCQPMKGFPEQGCCFQPTGENAWNVWMTFIAPLKWGWNACEMC